METLLDENASCHIAWGFGAPEIVDGAPELDDAGRDAPASTAPTCTPT